MHDDTLVGSGTPGDPLGVNTGPTYGLGPTIVGILQPVFPVGAPITTTIYARPLTNVPPGSDTTGNGTLAAPFLTFKHAIRNVPHVIPAGNRYVVDITGIGTEPLPADYEFPVIKNPGYFSLSFTDPNFLTRQSFEVRATPQLVSFVPPAPADALVGVNGVGDAFAVAAGIVTLTDAAALFTATMIGQSIVITGSATIANNGTFIILGVGGGGTTVTYANAFGWAEAFPGRWHVIAAVVTNDPDTDNVIITLIPYPGNSPRANWGGNALAGKQIRSAVGGSAFSNTGTIWRSTPTTLEIAFRAGGAPNPTLPIEIVEPSATLSGSDSAPAPFAISGQAVTISECGVFGLKGIKIVNTGLSALDLALGMNGVTEPILEMCDIAGLAMDLTNPVILSCYIHNKNVSGFGNWFCQRSYLRGIPSFSGIGTGPMTWQFRGDVFENCPSVGPRRNGFVPIGLNHPIGLTLQGVQILNPVADGAFAANGVVLAGSVGRMSRVKISGCPANAVYVGEANGFLEMFDVVGGTGFPGAPVTLVGADPVNVGFGVLVNDGSIVRVKDNGTLVTGTAGDMKVGTLALRTWADFRTALPGPAPSGKGIKNEYDLNRAIIETGDEFSVVAGVVTLTCTAAVFTPSMVGQLIAVSGSTTPANDGVFVVASWVNASNITYANSVGFAELFGGTWKVLSTYTQGDEVTGAATGGVSGSRLYQRP